MIETRGPARRARNRTPSAVFRRLGEAEAAVHQVPDREGALPRSGRGRFHLPTSWAPALAFDLLGVDDHRLLADQRRQRHREDGARHAAGARAGHRGLLAGKPVYARGPAVELTTPTGAAVAATLAARFGVLPPMSITRTGYGAGDHDFPEHANVLRVILGETTGAREADYRLRDRSQHRRPQPAGARPTPSSACSRPARSMSRSQPLVMKKGRPGTLLRVIAQPEDREALAQIIFAETSTLGAAHLHRRAPRAGAHA